MTGAGLEGLIGCDGSHQRLFSSQAMEVLSRQGSLGIDRQWVRSC